MPKLQIDGIDIADLDEATASTLRHLVLRVGTGGLDGRLEQRVEPERTAVTHQSEAWAVSAQTEITRVGLKLRFQVSDRHAAHQLG